jgi:glycosyltransferase involved in cell wall biosynthesis
MARGNRGKNEDKIEEACHALGIPFTLIFAYDHAEMPEQYRKYKVFISASTTERMSLVVGEALCAGCRVLATTANRGNEWYPGLATIDPNGTPEHFEERIGKTYHADSWDWSPNTAARHLTWDGVTQKLIGIYQEALQ